MAVTPGGPGRQTARWPRPRPLSLEGYRSPPTPRATQDEYGVKTLSDCAALARKNPAAASMCVESESQSRDDGFPGVEKAYAFNLPNTSEYLLDTAVVHTELSWGGTCNFGEVYDRWPGRVAEIPGGPGRQEVLPDPQPGALRPKRCGEKYRGLEALFKPICDNLTAETLLALNKEVSVDGKKPRAVAEEWMRSEGFVN
jgi:osmoprotectant transport system substrate-binding protein